MSHPTTYYIGAFVGLLIGLLISAVVLTIRKKKHGTCTFDERQELVRGKAFKCGFFSLIIYLILYGFIADATGFTWGSYFTSVLVSICVGVGFTTIYSIWHDAYFALREQPKPYVILLFCLMCINFFGAFRHLTSAASLSDMVSPNLIIAILLLLILLTIGIKAICDKKTSEQE